MHNIVLLIIGNTPYSRSLELLIIHLAFFKKTAVIEDSKSRTHSTPQSPTLLAVYREAARLLEDMAAHSSILSWRIPWTEKPGGLWSMGSQRVRHD